MNVTLLGLGGGTLRHITSEGLDKLNKADVIIGAERLLAALDNISAEKIPMVYPERIAEYIKANADKRIVCVYSGDTGFYSGTTSLLKYGIEAEIIPGISSIQMMASALQEPWQDWNLVSAHGREVSITGEVMKGRKTFLLLDGKTTAQQVCISLTEAGLGSLEVAVGENLSSDNERVTRGRAAELAGTAFAPLSVMVIDPAPAGRVNHPGIADELFLRGNVPMTKQEVRANVLAKLSPDETDTIWDVGAGTGSVTVELALAAKMGRTYAIECNEEGVELIKENRKLHGAWNIIPVLGMAPEALSDLPSPDKVFIGGTKNNMGEIIDVVMNKNDKAVITITAIAIETIGRAVAALSDRGYEIDICQIQSSNGSKAGSLHLMKANNPIYIITGRRND